MRDPDVAAEVRRHVTPVPNVAIDRAVRINGEIERIAGLRGHRGIALGLNAFAAWVAAPVAGRYIGVGT